MGWTWDTAVHVRHEFICTADIDELGESDLRHDCTELAAGSRNTVGGGTVASGKYFAGDDERRGVGPEILKEVREAVQENERISPGGRCDELVVCETCSTH